MLTCEWRRYLIIQICQFIAKNEKHYNKEKHKNTDQNIILVKREVVKSNDSLDEGTRLEFQMSKR